MFVSIVIPDFYSRLRRSAIFRMRVRVSVFCITKEMRMPLLFKDESMVFRRNLALPVLFLGVLIGVMGSAGCV